MPLFRGRYRSWAGRARSYRRRYHNRGYWWSKRRSYRRRGGRARGRRYGRVRRRPHTQIVRVTRPPHTARCTIRGWWPVLYAYVGTPVSTQMPKVQGLTTFKNYPNDNGGCVAWGQMSLQVFYDEHKAKRNLWSRSNCQFDLCRYFGTMFTLWPHQSIDYIFHWDTDYGSTYEIEKRYVHPAFMLNMPKHRVCLSVKTRGFWKPVRVFMPRPSIYSTQWEFQNTWAGRGLGFWAVSAIDLLYPWTRRWAKSEQDVPVRWWDDETYKEQTLPKWLAEYWRYLDQNNPSYKMQPEAAEGPMVQKTIQDSLNVLLTYKSFWQWGGEWAQPVAACDPKGRTPGYQQPIANPRSFADPGDYDRFGILKDIALKRLTKPSPERNTRAFSGFLSSSETEDSEASEDEPRSKRVRFEDEHSEETEEEAENSSPPLVRHRRQHRRRTSVEQLRRLFLKCLSKGNH